MTTTRVKRKPLTNAANNQRQQIDKHSHLYAIFNDTRDTFAADLPARDVVSLSSTCKAFKQLFVTSPIWRTYYENDFGHLYDEQHYDAQYKAEWLWRRICNLDDPQGDSKIDVHQLFALLNQYKQEAWTAYYFTALSIFDEDKKPNKIVADCLCLLDKGEVRIAYFLLVYLAAHRAKLTETIRQLFHSLSALINHQVPIAIADFSSLHLALDNIPHQSKAEKTHYIEIIQAFYIMYLLLIANADKTNRTVYLGYARQLFADAVSVYAHDNEMNPIIALIKRLMELINLEHGKEVKQFKQFCEERPSARVIEVVGEFVCSWPDSITPWLKAFVRKCANAGDKRAAYFYGKSVAFQKPLKAIPYLLDAIEGKEPGAISELFNIVDMHPHAVNMDAHKLAVLLREGVKQGEIGCIQRMAMEIMNQADTIKWYKDTYKIWVMQTYTCLSFDAFVKKRDSDDEWEEREADRHHRDVLFNYAFYNGFEFLKTGCKREDGTIYVYCAFAMVYALKGHKAGPNDGRLRELAKHNYSSLLAYVNVGKQHGFYTPEIDAVVKRLLPDMGQDINLDVSDEEESAPRCC